MQAQDPLSVASKLPTTLQPSEARVERDPATGSILRVIYPPRENSNPLNDPLNDLSDVEDAKTIDDIASSHVVRLLEEQASMEVKKRPRQQSAREEEWIAVLVERHGDDYGGMMRDQKLNPYQQSEGDLRRRVNKWKERRWRVDEG